MEESMSNGTKVKKRDGSLEPLNLDKIHRMVDEACADLAGVSASQVEMNSGIQFFDGITTEEIQEEVPSSKMKVSELKAKIKEDIISLLQEEEEEDVEGEGGEEGEEEAEEEEPEEEEE